MPHSTANYAAIERHAHELRRQAIAEMTQDAGSWLQHEIELARDLFASIRGRMDRNRDAVFFEQQ